MTYPELPELAKALRERYPNIGRFDLEPLPHGVGLHIIGGVGEGGRIQEIGREIERDPEMMALGIRRVMHSLYASMEPF